MSNVEGKRGKSLCRWTDWRLHIINNFFSLSSKSLR